MSRVEHQKGIDSLEDHLASLNNRIREMMNFVLRPHSLKHVEWRLLNCLSQANPLTICDLAELAVIERTVTSRLVDKMAERKLIRKVVSQHDRRFAQVSLTAQGSKLLVSCAADVSTARVGLLKKLSTEQIAALLTCIEQMQVNTQNVYREIGANKVYSRKTSALG